MLPQKEGRAIPRPKRRVTTVSLPPGSHPSPFFPRSGQGISRGLETPLRLFETGDPSFNSTLRGLRHSGASLIKSTLELLGGLFLSLHGALDGSVDPDHNLGPKIEAEKVQGFSEFVWNFYSLIETIRHL